LGDGKTENVIIILSGYSSRIFEISNVPMPDPVPPPNEWHTWKPARKNTAMYAMSEHRDEKASFCPEKTNKHSRKSIQEKAQCADKAENANIELLYV
jgi:hypothetical protein